MRKKNKNDLIFIKQCLSSLETENTYRNNLEKKLITSQNKEKNPHIKTTFLFETQLAQLQYELLQTILANHYWDCITRIVKTNHNIKTKLDNKENQMYRHINGLRKNN